ncbi:MAG TPA: sulfotransferase [Rhizomicrobium sp.]|nr:sulfotransferase [Rhizomicrobium sp.]
MTAKPFFIVSSGRSGTAMLHKLFSGIEDVEMHHEYAVQIVQPLAVRRYLELAGATETRRILAQTHGASIRYSEKAYWGDSSNKLSWLIPDLAALFPEAKFVHLVRDGRKVAGSYFRKLGAECYDDRSNAIFQAFYDDPARNPAPPPEKKYWWPVPRKGSADDQTFRLFDQFGRISWHWAEINRVILTSLAELPEHRKTFVRLEDLRSSPETLKTLLQFLNFGYRDAYFALLQRPHNVNKPQDAMLTDRERDTFDRIAGTMMARLGYRDSVEYVVNY